MQLLPSILDISDKITLKTVRKQGWLVVRGPYLSPTNVAHVLNSRPSMVSGLSSLALYCASRGSPPYFTFPSQQKINISFDFIYNFAIQFSLICTLARKQSLTLAYWLLGRNDSDDDDDDYYVQDDSKSQHSVNAWSWNTVSHQY